MIVHRVPMLPAVRISRNPENVCLRTALAISSNESTYYETTLSPDEAEALGLDLMLDARRARAMRASNEWLETS